MFEYSCPYFPTTTFPCPIHPHLLSSFLKILSLLCFSSWVFFPTLPSKTPIHFSASSNLLFIPSSVLFISDIALFFSLNIFGTFLLLDFIYSFLERGREGKKREREASVYGCLSSAYYWGPGPQPRPVL